MAVRNLYVRDIDLAIWQAAEAAASAERRSLSQYVTLVLEAHFANLEKS